MKQNWRQRMMVWTAGMAVLVATAGLSGLSLGAAESGAATARIPVILDTDIGDDIDDTWALGLALRSPELDVKLVVGDYGRAQYRARLLAKFLERIGRTDVAVGVGLDVAPKGDDGRQSEWIKGYDLKSYPGKVHADGVGAMIDLILKSERPVTLIAVGPLPNVAAMLQREPRVAERARFVGMHGSVRLGYGGSTNLSAEWNVRADAKSCQKVFVAPWDMTITPLDTCGLVHLRGDKYARVRDSRDPVAVAIMENYRAWAASSDDKNLQAQPAKRSSTLFDTVAVYLAFSQTYCKMEKLGLRVTDDGYTRLDAAAKVVNVATAWQDMGAFEDLLARRVTEPKNLQAPY